MKTLIIDTKNFYKKRKICYSKWKKEKNIKIEEKKIKQKLINIERKKEKYIITQQRKNKKNITIKRNKKIKNHIDFVPLDNMCLMCFSKNNYVSKHHIIPRKYGGENNIENLINLCNNCHDYVEIKTEDYIKKYKHYDVEILRSLIINNGF